VKVKINFSISFLSGLCNFRLPRIPNNLYDSTKILNIDEGAMLVDNSSKILQTKSVLQIQNARFIPVSLSRNMRFASNARLVFGLSKNARPRSACFKKQLSRF